MYSLYRFPIDRSLFDGTCGLSCVENLLIFALRASGMAYPYLFYRSHLTLPAIMKEFSEKNVSYARFGAVERIQELAVREDLLSMELHASLHDGLCGPEKAWVFVMLTPEAVLEKYRTEMLRDGFSDMRCISAWRSCFFVFLTRRSTVISSMCATSTRADVSAVL